jgi:REP element-mobilizing transposase RayT
MARPLRIEYEGAVYHVTSRGNGRQSIFLVDSDREAFLEVLSDAVRRFGWICHAYCLMTNHYHLLLETPEANLSRGMRHLNGVYTQAFNRRHARSGHVMQGRFKAILVEKESHLLELARYVVLNPVRARAARSARDWPWSSYRATAGIGEAPEFLTTDWILARFHRSRARATNLYREFVKQGRGVDAWAELRGGI